MFLHVSLREKQAVLLIVTKHFHLLGYLLLFSDALLNFLECNNDTERCSLFIDILSIIALQEQYGVFKVLEGM